MTAAACSTACRARGAGRAWPRPAPARSPEWRDRRSARPAAAAPGGRGGPRRRRRGRAHQRAAIDQRQHHFLDEEGVAAGAFADQPARVRGRGVVADQAAQQHIGRRRRQRGEREHPIVRRARPGRLVAGPQRRPAGACASIRARRRSRRARASASGSTQCASSTKSTSGPVALCACTSRRRKSPRRARRCSSSRAPAVRDRGTSRRSQASGSISALARPSRWRPRRIRARLDVGSITGVDAEQRAHQLEDGQQANAGGVGRAVRLGHCDAARAALSRPARGRAASCRPRARRPRR